MSWRVATSLETLRAEINALAPNRSTLSDGSIGDTSHQATPSDHNPNAAGVVRARDFTHDPAGGFDCNAFAAQVAALLGKHPALGSGAYVIWNRRIISTSRLSEGWRYYSGSNPHDKHAHVSVQTSAPGYDSAAPWLGEEDDMKEEDFDRIDALFAARLEEALAEIGDERLANPDDKGPKTRSLAGLAWLILRVAQSIRVDVKVIREYVERANGKK